MKGIILAGGSGTRLYPATKTVCKQLLPIYDKPLIYYPLSTLMLAGIKEILIISTPQDISHFKKLFGDGLQLGLTFSYAIQDAPNGIAEAFIIGKEFIGDDSVALILGDNIFYGHDFISLLQSSIENLKNGATVFGYYVQDPQRYGVVTFNSDKNVISVDEKPDIPQSNYAITGLYFYDNSVVQKAQSVQPSSRGEIEITSINNLYLDEGNLTVELLGRGFAWLDTGTHASMMDASVYVKTIEDRTGLKIGCIEEVAWRLGYINEKQFMTLREAYGSTSYGEYLESLLKRYVA